MANWIETCRGTVAPWECDITEHFTIAYYLDRVDQAEADLADRLGVADVLRTGGFPRQFTLRFVHELRAGDSFTSRALRSGSIRGCGSGTALSTRSAARP